MKVPCKGCEFREIACHVKCPMYRMYKREKEKETKCNAKRGDVSDYVRGNVIKIRHKMRKAKYGCEVRD